MSVTGRHPDPKRYALVEKLVRKGHPDHDVVKMVMAEMGCCGNTVRNDLRLLLNELRETNAQTLAYRRDVMRFQLGALQVELRDVATKAAEGYMANGPDGPVLVQDPKTASMALGTAEKVFARLAQLDGISESDRLKADMLRQKLLESYSAEELEKAIAAEAESHLQRMSDAELEALIERRKAGP